MNLFKVNKKDTRTTSLDVVLVSFLLTLHTFIMMILCTIVTLEQVITCWVNDENFAFEMIYLDLF